MKTLLLACALTLGSVTACTTMPLAPGAVAEQSTADEQAALAVELAYKAARMAAELAVDAGVLKGQAAASVAALDKRAYQAVLATRAAYDAGNARGYAAAVISARLAIADFLTAIRG